MQRVATPAHRSVWWNEYLALLLTIWMVGTVVWAMGRAGWDPVLHRLPLVAAPAVLVGYGAARLWRVPISALHGIGFLAGGITCLAITLSAPGAGPGSPRHRLVLLWDRGVEWSRAAWQGQTLHDPILFLLVMSVLIFALAYWVIWWTFRISSSLLAIGVPGIALVTTVGIAALPGRWYLGAYLLAAIPLATRFAGFRQEWQWQKSWIAYPLSLRSRYLRAGSVLAVALILVTTLLPLSVRIDAIGEAWKRAQEPVQRAITQAQDRFSQAVDGQGQPTVIPGFASFGPTFRLAGSLNLSDAPAVALTAREPHYLSANAYDYYTGLGWEDHSTSTFNSQGPNGALYSPQVSVGAKQLVPRPTTGMEATTTIACDPQFLRPRGTLLYSCGQAETASVDTRVSLSWQQLGQTGIPLPAPANANIPPALTTLLRLVTNVEGLNLSGDVPAVGPSGEATLVRSDGTLVIAVGATRLQNWNPAPGDLAGYVARAAAQPAGAKPITRVLLTTPGSAASGATGIDPRFDAIEAEQDRLRKQLIDTQLVVQDGKATMLLYHGQTPNFADITALDAGTPVAAGERVETTARVSVATVEQLRTATTQYPAWLDRYRVLPDGSAPNTIATPQRVRDLATRLARGQTNTYDIAAAIEKYLRSTYGYATTIDSPPANRDVVDYFLFDAKQGYCEYFATAMTMLLRANGIPARIVTGYLPGSRQPDGTFLSRESQAHAWVEVWFPQYGWIMFDPTPRPDVPPIQRGPLPQQPLATPTPAPAPTAAPAPQQPASNAAAPTPTPTASAGPITGKSGPHLSPLLFLIPLTLALLWGLAAWYWFLPLRGLAPAAQWYARLQRSARMLGVPNAKAATPYETAEAIGERIPEGRTAAYAIAHSYAEEQYAGRPPHPAFAAHLRTAWNNLRSQTLRARLRRLSKRRKEN